MVTAVLGVIVTFSISISLVNGLKPVITKELICFVGWGFFVCFVLFLRGRYSASINKLKITFLHAKGFKLGNWYLLLGGIIILSS